MQRITVESSDIVSVGYDPKTLRLEVEFQGGRVYQYRDVPLELHEQFMRADSYGSFFNTFINNKFRFDRIAEQNISSTPKALAFVTGNEQKMRMLQLALEPYAIHAERISLPLDEIQSTDAARIATRKAKEAYRLATRPVLVMDSYWNILALRGFPGAYMHDVAVWLHAEDFLKLMADKQDRTVLRTDTLAYCDGKRTKLFARDHTGQLATSPQGSGISIDQLVIMDGQSGTIAEQDQAALQDKIEGSVWQEFAQWFNLQRRLGKA